MKFDANELEEQKGAEALAARLAGADVQIARKVGENDVLFGSVTSADIAEALAAKGVEIDRRKLHLVEPIKKLGDYKVSVKLHREVSVEIPVHVVKED